jgi:uncharacterized protein
MKIYVGELKREIGLSESYSFKFEGSPNAEHGDLAVFREPVTVEATLTNTGEGILADVSMKGSASLRCGRCLAKFETPIFSDFRVEYREGLRGEANEGDVASYSGDHIDLDEEIRQNLILSLPMRALCNEACKGLCPSCGADLNQGGCSCDGAPVDFRLAGLREFQARLRGRGGES